MLGLTKDQEHEGMDRADTLLPGLQETFALQVLAQAGKQTKPVVVVLVNGGSLSVDELIGPAGAVIESFNPIDLGTRAIAESVFGAANRYI